MHIVPFPADNPTAVQQAAALLISAFREHWPGSWSNMQEALDEVHECLEPDKFCLAALDYGRVVGWIGARPAYGVTGWELHPLLVEPARQGEGIGRALVHALEDEVRRRGGVAIFLGSDDVDGMTSLAGVDLYQDLAGHIRSIRNLKRHPYEFYQKVGYSIVGVIPDANGLGKPDIIMGKRVQEPSGGNTIGTSA